MCFFSEFFTSNFSWIQKAISHWIGTKISEDVHDHHDSLLLRCSNLFNKYFESDLINCTIKIGLNRWQSITIPCYEVTYLKHVWHGWKPKVSKYEMEKYELLKIWTVKKNQDGVKFRISGSRDFVSDKYCNCQKR